MKIKIREGFLDNLMGIFGGVLDMMFLMGIAAGVIVAVAIYLLVTRLL